MVIHEDDIRVYVMWIDRQNKKVKDFNSKENTEMSFRAGLQHLHK